jgi:hypothetical protein
MSFLDRFKPQPKWKHADPAVRAAAIADIPDDDEHQAVLRELAAADEDVRVRRAAVALLHHAQDLLPIARGERDEELRREIQERLLAIATAPADADGDAALALDGLDDTKHLATVAKSSPHETVRAAALGRIHDVKTLAGVARQAADPQTALDAVARVPDIAELVTIALKTDHKDAGIAALEKAFGEGAPGGATALIADSRETLDAIATRAKNKSIAKRARALVQATDDAAAARRAALEQWQQRVAAVVARVEAIAGAPALPSARADLASAEAEWREVAGSGTFELDAETAARCASLREAARLALDEHDRAEAERRVEAERREAINSARIALAERVETAPADAALDALETARAEWEGLPSPDAADTQYPALRARFDAACRHAASRHENRVELQRINARLDELSLEAERLSGEQTQADEAWRAVTQQWAALASRAEGADPVVLQRFTDAEARGRLRAEEKRAAAERTVRQHVQRVEQLVDRAQKRVTAEDVTLREADRLARDLRAALEAPPPVEDREKHALVERLKAAQAAVTPKLHELREMDEWKRFANAAVQEQLIARTEMLALKFGFNTPEGVKPEDLDKVARELHEIQERWRQAAEAPRAQAQALWHRYRQAADPIQVKVREFFAHRAEERDANLQRKLALLERAEALAQSTDWIKTADELRKLQAEWQQIGPVPRQDTRTTWKRFRQACDQFFSRRNADLAQRKETWAANLARKEALCVRAEEVAASIQWEKAAAEIRRLQTEWKGIGPVRRTKSEAIWQRFREACDAFFERYKRRDQIEVEVKQADREALVAELETLAAGSASAADAPALLERVRSLRSRWNQTTPVVRQGADPLSARFVEALERLITDSPDAFRGTELDVEANRQKMERLCLRVEGFANESAAPVSSSQALAAMLREALAANTIGGRAGEESKWRAIAEDLRQAQASWSRLGPVPGEAGRELAERFRRACGRFLEQYRRRMPQQQEKPRAGRPVGAR